MTAERIELLKSRIRDVPDFPKPGILFKDITPLLADPRAFTTCIDLFQEELVGRRLDAIVGIESRGFIFAGALAARMACSFVPVRKPGKLPSKADRVEYSLEYGQDALEMHTGALPKGARVVIVDDVIATGGTAWAACELVRRQGAEPVACAFAIELSFLGGNARIAPVESFALLRY